MKRKSSPNSSLDKDNAINFEKEVKSTSNNTEVSTGIEDKTEVITEKLESIHSKNSNIVIVNEIPDNNLYYSKNKSKNNINYTVIVIISFMISIMILEIFIRESVFNLSVEFITYIHKTFKDKALYDFAVFLSSLIKDKILIILFIVIYNYANILKSLAFITAVGSHNVINEYLKMIYQSPRPYWMGSDINLLECDYTYGNPSGHSFASIVVFMITYKVLFSHNKSLKSLKYLKIFFLILLFCLSILIACSRVVLGVHSINQIVYGFTLGLIFFYLIAYLLFNDDFNNSEILVKLLWLKKDESTENNGSRDPELTDTYNIDTNENADKDDNLPFNFLKSKYRFLLSWIVIVTIYCLFITCNYLLLRSYESDSYYFEIVKSKCPNIKSSPAFINKSYISSLSIISTIGIVLAIALDFKYISRGKTSVFLKQNMPTKKAIHKKILLQNKNNDEDDQKDHRNVDKNNNSNDLSNNDDDSKTLLKKQNDNKKIINEEDEEYNYEDYTWNNTTESKSFIRLILTLLICAGIYFSLFYILPSNEHDEIEKWGVNNHLNFINVFKYNIICFSLMLYLLFFNKLLMNYLNLTCDLNEFTVENSNNTIILR